MWNSRNNRSNIWFQCFLFQKVWKRRYSECAKFDWRILFIAFINERLDERESNTSHTYSKNDCTEVVPCGRNHTQIESWAVALRGSLVVKNIAQGAHQIIERSSDIKYHYQEILANPPRSNNQWGGSTWDIKYAMLLGDDEYSFLISYGWVSSEPCVYVLGNDTEANRILTVNRAVTLRTTSSGMRIH